MNILSAKRDFQKSRGLPVSNIVQTDTQQKADDPKKKFSQTPLSFNNDFNKDVNNFETLTLTERIERAEALLSLAQVQTNTSFKSTAELIEVIKAFDPTSEVLKGIRMGYTKLNYVSVHGIAVYQKILFIIFYQSCIPDQPTNQCN